MIKHVFVGFLNGIDEILGERWYFRYHCKEVVRFFGPWLRRYETYKAYSPPPEGTNLGAVGGRMTELWYANVEDFIEAKPNSRPYTFEPWMRSSPREAITEGVSLNDGEKWYLDVHSKEACQQPGLLRYVSHRVLENPPIDTPWHRVEEMWYENFDAWRKAVIDSPPEYTPPPWRKEPPFVDSVSNFIKYKPDVDYLKDNPLIP